MVHAAADLRIGGTASYHLTGDLGIPQARLELRALPPTSVSMSGDKVIAGQFEEHPVEPAAPPNLSAVEVRADSRRVPESIRRKICFTA